MIPTALRDRLLQLEARTAMLEDRAQVIRSRARGYLTTARYALELLAFYVVLWAISKFLPPGEK